MFQFISSKLAQLLSLLLAFVSPMSAQPLSSSEKQNMELIAHKQMGSGKEKVLVMHSWTGDMTSYDLMLPYLNTDAYTYVFVDLRGYGCSKEMSGTYTVEEASSDAIKLVDSLGWDQFHLIGHSMSGMIAQKIAVDNPSRVKSVVAITPVPACGTPGPKDVMDHFESIAINNDEGAMGFVNAMTSNRYTDAFAKKMITEFRQISTSQARVGYMNMYFNTDFSESVKGLQTPILVLFGEYDSEVLGEAAMRNTFLKWYPNAQLECCQASGHYPMLETPVALVTAIEKFLSAHSSETLNEKHSELDATRL
ncbi:MAG: alpha/beta hydrolase [Candidatus Melainabacteria bacterium]|nr:alpha/beta hydrolase [Candidatus Melainabacteria bacterium]